MEAIAQSQTRMERSRRFMNRDVAQRIKGGKGFWIGFATRLEGRGVRRGVTNFVPYGTKKWSLETSRILFRTEHENGRSKCHGFCSVRNMKMVAWNVAGFVPYGTKFVTHPKYL